MFSFKDFLKSSYSFCYRYIFTGKSGKLLCYMEWLRKESLNLSCSVYDNLVVL